MKKILLLLSAALFCSSAAFAMSTTNSIDTADITTPTIMTTATPAVPEAVAGQSVALSVDINNTGEKARHIVAVYSSVAKQAQLHKVVMRDKVSEMQPIKEIVLPPHHVDHLQAGNFHIMLINLKHALEKGQHVPFTLIFSDGSYAHLVAVVR